VFERDKMLLGQVARMVYFDLLAVDSNLGGMLPSDLDGATPPPAGAPNAFVVFDDNAWGTPRPAAVLEFPRRLDHTGEFDVHQGAALGTAAFDANLCGYARNCVPQPGTSARLDTISDRLMYRLQYRQFRQP